MEQSFTTLIGQPFFNYWEALKLLLIEAVISCVYVFDASASPLLHIPLPYLTVLYFVSMLEVMGVSCFLRFLRSRANNSRPTKDHHETGTALLRLVLRATGFDLPGYLA